MSGKITLFAAGWAVSCFLVAGIERLEAMQLEDDNVQILCYEMCINKQECIPGNVFIAIVNDETRLIISKDGVSESIAIDQKTTANGDYFIWSFANDRGFFCIGKYSPYAFMRLDNQHIMLGVRLSTLNPNDK